MESKSVLAIETTNLERTYHVGNEAVRALRGIDLQIAKGQFIGLKGRSGSGKTTLLNVMYGIIKPDEGEMKLNDNDLIYTDIAYMETVNFFYRRITGYEYLGIFRTQNKDFDIEKWNRIFELPLDTYIDSYSTGMKKKLALMGVLSLDRKIFILDEPFNSLDLETNNLLYIIMRFLKKSGKTILVTSHIIETLTSICDCIHFLEDGKIDKTFTGKDFPEISEYIFSGRDREKIELAEELISGIK